MKIIKNYIQYLTRHVIVRYILAGGTSAVINICILSFLYYRYHIHYLLAATVAFIGAFFFSLFAHKLWTFQDKSRDQLHMQVGKYLLSSLFGLFLNDIILYVCVHSFHVYVVVGEIIAGAFVASITFFISRYLIFNNQ